MSEQAYALDQELDRLMHLDEAVRSYLSHLWAFEQGSDHDALFVEHWRDEMARLTGDDDD